jgi:epoxide hydrolase 4
MRLGERIISLSSDGVRLATFSQGSGEAMIMLHGFPDFHWGWRNQVRSLQAAGIRWFAPDMRGYGESGTPAGIRHYRLERLVSDVLEIAAGQGIERFHLVGHDWGGIVALATAAWHPQRVLRLTILNAPHLDIVATTIRRHPSQVLRSLYVGLFQVPRLPEAVLRAGEFSLLKWMVKKTALPSSFKRDDLDVYVRQWAEPGRLTAMLSYYRALLRYSHPPLGRIATPTQILWGRRDPALGYFLAEASLVMCQQAELISFDRASHWLQLDEPDAVSERLINFHSRGA